MNEQRINKPVAKPVPEADLLWLEIAHAEHARDDIELLLLEYAIVSKPDVAPTNEAQQSRKERPVKPLSCLPSGSTSDPKRTLSPDTGKD